MNRRHDITLLGTGLMLAGCAHSWRSTALGPGLLRSRIGLQRSLPAVLPSGAQELTQEQLVLQPGEPAAGVLMPISFLAGAIGRAMDRSEAATEAAQLAPHRRPCAGAAGLARLGAADRCG